MSFYKDIDINENFIEGDVTNYKHKINNNDLYNNETILRKTILNRVIYKLKIDHMIYSSFLI